MKQLNKVKDILKNDDCGCGKSLKTKDSRRKNIAPKRIIKKKNYLK
jgi:hypothetical protein